MESTLQQPTTHQQLVREFDRLGEKIEQASELISRLRTERDNYRDEC